MSSPAESPEIERRVRDIGDALFTAMDAHPAPGLFTKHGVFARVMDWSMKDPAFKAQLFRFVDVLPALKSSGDIVRHLQEYLGDRAVELNPAMKAGLAASSFAPALVAGPVKANVSAMARQFVAGESPAELVQQLLRNAQLGLATTIDLLGETVVSEAEAMPSSPATSPSSIPSPPPSRRTRNPRSAISAQRARSPDSTSRSKSRR